LSVSIFLPHLRIKWLKAGRQNDRPYIDFYLLRPLIEIYGLIRTNCRANSTFLFFKVKAAFIYISDQGNGLSKIDMYGFILRYFLIKWIRILDGTILYTGSTTPAFALYNVSGLFNQVDREVSFFP
jgi:hypothetical protein